VKLAVVGLVISAPSVDRNIAPMLQGEDAKEDTQSILVIVAKVVVLVLSSLDNNLLTR